jgi:ubiquinone/menaquinone biosynthesis C-methylase UbiE
MEKHLERTWNASYPESEGERLWPDEVVPIVNLALRFFRPGYPILDLPCGDGKNVLALAERASVIAADSSERALKICHAHSRRAKQPNVVTLQADVFGTPFLNETFESIFCCDLLGHLPAPEQALKELRRITSRTGTVVGTLFTTEDSVLEDARMARQEDGSYMFRNQWYFRFYTEAQAYELCTRAGFDVIDLQEFTWWEDPHPGYREYRHRHSSWGLALRRA